LLSRGTDGIEGHVLHGTPEKSGLLARRCRTSSGDWLPRPDCSRRRCSGDRWPEGRSTQVLVRTDLGGR
jgi:hypothetical protein